MVTKSKTESAEKRGKVKVGKLKLNKETVKNLGHKDTKGIKGGQARRTITCNEECNSYACMESYA